MSLLSNLRRIHLFYLSLPRSNRPIYRAIYRHRVKKIVELGIGVGSRAVQMIKAASYHIPTAQVFYVGLDPFEQRTSRDGFGLTLKMAHRLLRRTRACVQLIPGDPSLSLVRYANDLGKVDLLLFSANVDLESYPRMWLFIPRLLHDNTLVYLERLLADGQPVVRRMERPELEALVAAHTSRRAA